MTSRTLRLRYCAIIYSATVDCHLYTYSVAHVRVSWTVCCRQVYQAVREYACTAVDVLARRTRLAFLNVNAAQQALPMVIDIMAKELAWSKDRRKVCVGACVWLWIARNRVIVFGRQQATVNLDGELVLSCVGGNWESRTVPSSRDGSEPKGREPKSARQLHRWRD